MTETQQAKILSYENQNKHLTISVKFKTCTCIANMFGLIESWLFTLGINCNLKKIEENNVFQDGSVLVNILQKYGLVSGNFGENIHPTTKKEECTKNLKLLKPLFDMLKIKYNETIVSGITENKIGTIINLLFELYICLENKQHLYFITQQNFEKVCQDTVKHLNSVTVNENIQQTENNLSTNMCLEQPLIDNAEIIKWYKNKYEKVKNNLDEKANHLKKPLLTKEIMNVKATCKTCLSKYKSTNNSEPFEDLPDINSFLKSSGDENILDYEAFIARYKSKQNSKAAKKCFENAIQHELLQRTWSRIEEKEDEIYNLVFSGVLLKQSHYEKQILSKLIEAQKETYTQNENRIWAKQIVINEHEKHITSDFELREKFEMLEQIYKNEQKRVLELHKKLYKEKKEITKKENCNICEDIVDALLDLAICAAEYKSNNGVEVSKGLWDNWMQLFVKSQPVHVQLQSLEDSAGEDVDYDEAISFEKEQDEVLNENDIDEYLMTRGRWFYSSVCLEHADLNEKNLAFIVYRLLFMKYPLPPSPPAADLPHFEIAGVLINFHSADSVEKLKLLLSKPGIHIFDTEMAIKKCMNQYQIETAPPPEEKLKSKKNDSVSGIVKKSKQQGGKDKKDTKKKHSKMSEKTKLNKNGKLDPILNYTEDDKIVNVVEKETQTSIVIETEEDKTKRTPLGLLGEEVCNMLKEGRKLNDSLLVSVITEYLKTLEEYDGWLLLNYPVTIGQAFHLELALTGKQIPVEVFVSEENKTLEVEELDEWSEKRKSRLLNYPISETDTQSFKSYFTIFVKVQDEDHEITAAGNNILQDVDQSSHSVKSNEIKEEVNTIPEFLKEFYNNQAIFNEFFYKPSDLNSLKSLARVILKEDGIEAKPSIDLFGKETLNKMTKGKKTDKKGKPSLTNKKPKTKGEVKSKHKINDTLINRSSDTNQENDAVVDIFDKETNPEITGSSENLNDLPTQVGEQNDISWNFVSLPLNNEFGVLLATMWENIESCYISNLKDIFFENRFINLRLHPYCVYVEKEMKKVIDKQDLKQNLINFFQEYYNSISNELRTLPEMKNQLHCRVLELQQNLWEIADERKKEIETKRQDIIYENWLVSEICLLINNYLSFVQTEVERSLETLQLVNDYYMNMLERTPSALTIQPEIRNVGKISVEMLLNAAQKLSIAAEQIEVHDNDEVNKNNCIALSLVCCSDEQKPIDYFETIFSEKIRDIMSNFSSISHIFQTQNKTVANVIVNSNKEGAKVKSTTNKERTSVKPKKEILKHKPLQEPNQSQQEEQDKISMKEALIKEWQTTINTETERFNFRLDLIHQRAKENIFEFYCFLESVFCNLHKSILSSYNTEISNINLICDYLKTAIEEESPLQHPLILGQDNFFIGIKDTVKKAGDYALTELKEDFHECIFTIKQLSYLMDIFKIASPFGVIRKQPLCYILKDLMLLDTYDNHPYLPKIWGFLSEMQMRYVIDDIFGLEFGVDWRDFIIYNLDTPYPEVQDILHLRKQFLSYDLEETELILQADYENITLWFENELPSSPKQGLRFALVKKLLSEMFKVDSEHINYTALVLYFCKDFNPVNGFKKALSLSLGKNVVVSKSELEMILQNEEDINEVVCSVLKDVIDGIVITKETAQVYEIIDSISQRDLSNIDSREDSWKSSLFGSFQSESFKFLGTGPVPPTPPNSLLHEHQTSQNHFSNTPSNEKSWVTKIPVASVLSVLNASFFYQDRRFALKNQYLNCLEDEADSDGMIEAYDLINLSCIQKLFTMTNKFKISVPCDILIQCLNDDCQDGSILRRLSTAFQP